MPPVRLRNLDRLGADARRQIRATLKSQRNDNSQPNTVVESLSEARRYGELKIEEMAEIIANLEVHKPFRLMVNGIHICDYESDFTYRRDGRLVVDASRVKSKPTVTRLYRVKNKLMLAVLGITIQQVYDP